MKLNILYVGLTDRQRALKFYEAVFQRPSVPAEERFSMFDLGDLRRYGGVEVWK